MDEQTERLIAESLRQFPHNQPAGLDMIERAVESGDKRARAVRAWMYLQQGRLADAASEVLDLVKRGGVAYLPMWAGQQLVSQADSSLRRLGVELLGHSGPVTYDPFSMAQQLVQQDDAPAALDLLADAVRPRPSDQPEAWWTDLASQADDRLQQIHQAAVDAQSEKEHLLADVESAREDVGRARDDLTRLVQEVGGLAGRAGAAVQADDYGRRADTIERRANWLTIAAIGLGFVIAIGALLLAVSASKAADPLKSAVEKVPISIPLLLINLYIGRLAATYRQEAVQLRHIELQIRTANPFLGALDEDRRKAVLAMLALRFFPGQPLPVPNHTSEPPDVAEALGTLLASSDGRTPLKVPNVPPASTPSADAVP